MAINFWGFGNKRRSADSAATQRTDPSAADAPIIPGLNPSAAAGAPPSRGGEHERMRLMAGLGICFFLCAATTVLLTARRARSEAHEIALVGDILMHTQRLAKAAPGAVQGEPEQVDELIESRDQVNADFDLLAKGDPEQAMAPTDAAIAPLLLTLIERWRATLEAADVIIAGRRALVGIGDSARRITQNSARVGELLATIAADQRRSGSPAHEAAAAEQLGALHQQITNSANLIVASSTAQNTQGFERDVQSFVDGVQALLNSTTDVSTRASLQEIQRSYRDMQPSASGAVNAQQALVEAHNAQITISAEAEPLRLQTVDLAGRYAGQRGWLLVYYAALGGFSLLALGCAVGVVRALLVQARRRAAEAEAGRVEAQRLEEQAKRRNDQNQTAILRLMNELQEVADGNLTIAATVTEDITGAIADSINFTVEELRTLVGRINQTAELISGAAGQAREVASRLLAASEAQSREIRKTGERVLGMASQISEVSTSAGDSAKVGRASLEAADRGQRAVYNQIAGMNEIRDQIQETSKRIKRLGESSQEISEIVELISDITEQTNVLALNAAIQAATAGEAGRGFAVVAEEVQRLADRSGEAAKQIAALVRAIQTDTQDAVAAMERSTQEVVEGTRLSDAAGTALAEIGRVSRQLTELIEGIAQTTALQAQSAGDVSQSIERILEVTEQAAKGTRQTTQSVGQLAGLARELKDSVARFRVS